MANRKTRTLQFKVLTPAELVLERDADSIVVPLVDGWLGVLPGHAPFVGRIVPGELLVRVQDDEQRIATTGGIVRVGPTRVTALVGNAALDTRLRDLQARIDEVSAQNAELELQVEKRIEALYRQMAGVTRSRQS